MSYTDVAGETNDLLAGIYKQIEALGGINPKAGVTVYVGSAEYKMLMGHIDRCGAHPHKPASDLPTLGGLPLVRVARESYLRVA